jgi:hypothetical protein
MNQRMNLINNPVPYVPIRPNPPPPPMQIERAAPPPP